MQIVSLWWTSLSSGFNEVQKQSHISSMSELQFFFNNNHQNSQVQSIYFNITQDGLVNITNLNYVTPVLNSALSIANSVLFLVAFAVYYMCLMALLFKIFQQDKEMGIVTSCCGCLGHGGHSEGVTTMASDRTLKTAKNSQQKPMKKNPKVLILLAVIFVAIQSMNLLVRLVMDVLFIFARQTIENGQMITWSLLSCLHVLIGISTLFMFSNFMFLFVILYHVQMIFWKTARLMRAITQKTFKVICWLTNISIVVFLIIGWTVVLLVSIFLTLGRFEIVDKTTNTIVNICCLLIVTILFVIDTISVTTSGILVMRTIRRTASKVKDTVAQQKAKNPFVITIALMIGLIACVLLQIIAAVIASAIVLVDERFKVLWHFVNCLGILIFATLTLLLFYPMFVQTDKVMKELHLDDTKSNISNYSGTAHGEIPNSPIKTGPYHKSMPRFSGLADNQQEGLSLVISTEVARLTPMPHSPSVPTSVVVVEGSNTKASVESSSFAAHSTTVTAVSTTGTDERTLMTSSPMEASSGNNLSSEMTII